MADKNYLVSWKNHLSEVSSMLHRLRDDKCYTDATIACDGSYFPVHRIILSTSSHYFKELFHQTNKLHLLMHPVIVLHDMKKDIVQAILDYIYLGEVSVSEYNLPKFLNAAKVLDIKDLGCGGFADFSDGQDTESTPVSTSDIECVDPSENVELIQNEKKRKLQENVSSEIVVTKHRKFIDNISLNSKTVRNAGVENINDGETAKQGTQCNSSEETCSFQPCTLSENDNPLDTEGGISHSIDDHSTTLHHNMGASDCYSNQLKDVDRASSYGTKEEVFTSVGIYETSEPVPGPSGFSIPCRVADKDKMESDGSDLDESKAGSSIGIKEEVIKEELDDFLSDTLCKEAELVYLPDVHQSMSMSQLHHLKLMSGDLVAPFSSATSVSKRNLLLQKSRKTMPVCREEDTPPTPEEGDEAVLEEEECVLGDEHVLSLSEEEGPQSGASMLRKRRSRGPPCIFTDEQERDLGVWYQANECFYNRKLKSYKDIDKKNWLLEEKAASMTPPCTVRQLKTFFESMRTRFGKITKPKVGQAVPELSERDQWIMNTFGFLKEHIKHLPTRRASKFVYLPHVSQSMSLSQLHQLKLVSGDIVAPFSSMTSESAHNMPPRIFRKTKPMGRKDGGEEAALQEDECVLEDEEYSQSWINIPRKKRFRSTPCLFTDEQERDLGEWYKTNECFYNSKLKSYKDTDKKNRLLEKKAASMNPPSTARQLKTFFESMRTRYGKITKSKLGQAAPGLTDRDKWIVNTFGFLKWHIRQTPTRRTPGHVLLTNVPVSAASAVPFSPVTSVNEHHLPFRKSRKTKLTVQEEDPSSPIPEQGEEQGHHFLEQVDHEEEETGDPQPSAQAEQVWLGEEASLLEDKDLPEDVEKGSQPGTSSPRKRRLREPPYLFTNEQERELGVWYQANECFYNKKLKSYKNTDKKTRLLEEKAASMNPPCSVLYLKTFFESMRTRYGKLSKPKLGQAAPELSERDQWIVNTFGFLKGHIKHTSTNFNC